MVTKYTRVIVVAMIFSTTIACVGCASKSYEQQKQEFKERVWWKIISVLFKVPAETIRYFKEDVINQVKCN